MVEVTKVPAANLLNTISCASRHPPPHNKILSSKISHSKLQQQILDLGVIEDDKQVPKAVINQLYGSTTAHSSRIKTKSMDN